MEMLIIIGSGPAGYTAAIYAARANLKPLLFEGSEPGGQLTTTSDVENYPGYPDGVPGPKMMEDLKKQAERFGTRIMNKTVTRVEFGTPTPPNLPSGRGGNKPISPPFQGGVRGGLFKVWCGEEMYESRAVIIATGASAKRLGLENEKKLYGKGVSACATCDGFFFKEKIVVVVGGGDTAMEESLFLTKFAKKVYVIHRRDEFRASKIMLERAQKNPKIEFILNTVVEDVLGADVGHVTGVKLNNLITKSLNNLPCDGVFAAIGHEPNTKIFAGQIELDQKGYVVTKAGSTMTSVEGVFAGGDCVDHQYRQAVTAAGLGCAAAIDAERWLEAQTH
ncbi:thioredoxin-disulfide reductase [Candidatus Uhrbacteria bacterium]|nr:thioredoxin-disulfide reductase [Candidatus Uhrbacteria bacterium]